MNEFKKGMAGYFIVVNSPADEFKTWMAKYFIERGSYRITDKAVKAFSDTRYILHSEYAGAYSNRNKESESGDIHILTKRERKETAKKKIASEIKEGNSLGLYMDGFVQPRCRWKNESIRTEVLRQFILTNDTYRKDLGKKEFQDGSLLGLIGEYYGGSRYLAIKAAGLADFEPWEMKTTPKNTFKSRKNRIGAVRWLLAKTGKKGRKMRSLEYEDFCGNRLGGLINDYYNGSPYLALKETGLAKFEPWEMEATPMNTFTSKETRIRAMKWLVEKTGKEAGELGNEDFYKNGLSGLLGNYYKDSSFRALQDAGLVYKPSDMKRKPNYVKK